MGLLVPQLLLLLVGGAQHRAQVAHGLKLTKLDTGAFERGLADSEESVLPSWKGRKHRGSESDIREGEWEFADLVVERKLQTLRAHVDHGLLERVALRLWRGLTQLCLESPPFVLCGSRNESAGGGQRALPLTTGRRSDSRSLTLASLYFIMGSLSLLRASVSLRCARRTRG